MEPFEYFPSRPADAENLAPFRRALAGLDRYRPLARSPERVRSQRMDRRRLLIVVVPAALAVCAGVAFAVPGGGHHVLPRGPVATHHARTTPSPSPTHDASDATARVQAGHHAVSGPAPVVERRVIHTSGSVGVESGTIAHDDNEHGGVGSPIPSRR